MGIVFSWVKKLIEEWHSPNRYRSRYICTGCGATKWMTEYEYRGSHCENPKCKYDFWVKI